MTEKKTPIVKNIKDNEKRIKEAFVNCDDLKVRKLVVGVEKEDGTVEKQSFVDYTVVTDERICDGYYFASGMKVLRSIIKNPRQLDNPPEKVIKDIK